MFRDLLERYEALLEQCECGCGLKKKDCRCSRKAKQDKEKTERGFGGMSRSGF